MKGYLLGGALLVACGAAQADSTDMTKYPVTYWIEKHCGNDARCTKVFQALLVTAYQQGAIDRDCDINGVCPKISDKERVVIDDLYNWVMPLTKKR